MELLQDLAAHYEGDHHMEAIHNEVVIKGKLAGNVPVAPSTVPVVDVDALGIR